MSEISGTNWLPMKNLLVKALLNDDNASCWYYQITKLKINRYGRFVAGAALVSFLVVNVDDLLVVRLGGIEVLGFYARACSSRDNRLLRHL